MTILVRVDGAALREARQDAGYTRRILAVDAGISFTDVGLMERGAAGEVDARVVDTLARLLDVPVERLAPVLAPTPNPVGR